MNPTVLPDPLLDARELVRRSLFGIFAGVFGINAILLATNPALSTVGKALLSSFSAALFLYSAAAGGCRGCAPNRPWSACAPAAWC
ncbi:hypothetical protein FSC37_19215 [Piscinibacter aquaticus]|uniref:Uncharacterized protein n=1 Tax=Piscinibacter aquaticus TaxID=392597 RepID=A0A5C6U4U2_9BURK|nr:hypothetical protein FSC37_19215 [Piscinibacter aquaticus]